MAILLSICIPTYNRSEFLKQTIDMIIKQADERIEIVISDNASEDDTQEIVLKYQEVFKNIKYFRWNENQGPDVNFLKVVDIASGEYCWLLGSDDGIVDCGIQTVLKSLDVECDLMLFNLFECDNKLKPFDEHYWIDSDEDEINYDFSKKKEVLSFFNSAQPLLGLFLGYISSILVKRSSWEKVEFDKKYIGSYFSFTYNVIQIINHEGKLRYIKEPLVLNRGHNDSIISEFGGNAELKRIMLDLDAYIEFSKVFDNKNIGNAYRDIGRRNYSWYPLIRGRSMMSAAEWKDAKSKFSELGCSQLLLMLVSFSVVVKPIIRSAFYFKTKYLPKVRIISRKLY